MQALKIKLVQVETCVVFFSLWCGKFLSYNPTCLSWEASHRDLVKLKYFSVTSFAVVKIKQIVMIDSKQYIL